MAYNSYVGGETLTETYRIPSGIFFRDSISPQVPLDLPLGHIFPTFPNARPLYKLRNLEDPAAQGLPEPLPSPGLSPTRSTKQQILCLPLLDVAVDVRVDANIATTRFTQQYTNISDLVVPEAHYTFPMYDGAVVTSFRYYIGDSDVLVGKVLSNEEARLEYIQAIENMEAAALLEEKTPEVFQTMIGNIQPKTSVKIEITFVSELKQDIGGHGNLVTIPTSLAPRYGTPPGGLSSSSKFVHTGLTIVVAVNSPRPIRQIECRSHPVSVEMGSAGVGPDLLAFDAFYATASSMDKESSEALDMCRATVRLSDPEVGMDKDFVVFIKTSGDDDTVAHSQAILSPINEHNHSALMVTIRPSELFSEYKPQMDFEGEIIFVADRSGSMEGQKIVGLREAIKVFLKSLPETCRFNLFSFGSSFTSLWESSKPYSQDTLDEAVIHVETYRADMGGTNLLPALEKLIDRRLIPSDSTQIVVITDGQVWNANETINFVQRTRSKLQDKFRLFVLGIGDNVSHRIIEGISGAGGGFGEVVGVATPDKWQHRMTRMLKSALMPPTWACQINLGPQFTRLDLLDDDFKSEKNRALQRDDNTFGYIQAPHSPTIHHFRQSSIFFLLKTSFATRLSEVTIVATAVANGGRAITVNLPVLCTASPDPTLQHLTAKSSLLDLELRADQQQLHDLTENSVARLNGIFLGKLYSITSRWTSFVATNGDGSESHAIDSYYALAGDLQLLTSPKPLTPPDIGSWTLGQDRASVGLRHSYSGAPSFDICMQGSSSAALADVSVFHPNRTASANASVFNSHPLTPFDGIYHRQPQCKEEYRPWDFPSQIYQSNTNDLSDTVNAGYAEGTTRNGLSEPAEMQEASYQGNISVNDIVDSQKASGRFQLSRELREKLDSNLPAGTREAIQGNMRVQNDSCNEVVDTLMMNEYIEAKLPDKKDYLELVVNKAAKSVGDHNPEGFGGVSADKNTMNQQEEEIDDEDEGET